MSRQQILDRIRRSLAQSATADAPPPARIPAVDPELDPEALFRARLEATGIGVEHLAHAGQVPDAVGRYLARHRLHGEIAVAPSLADLDWPTATDVHFGAPRDAHRVGVSVALAAVAETGSLLVAADAGNPGSLAFLPEHHLIVLRRDALVHHLETLLARPDVRARDGRARHLVSGPSSTADIGGQLLYGAHGPRAVHLLLVG